MVLLLTCRPLSMAGVRTLSVDSEVSESSLLRLADGGESDSVGREAGSYTWFLPDGSLPLCAPSCRKRQFGRVQSCLPGHGTSLNKPLDLNMIAQSNVYVE